MTSRVFTALAVAAALLLPACAVTSASQPVKPPPRLEKPRTEATPKRHEPRPDLVAPPPAYGNKVVMAQIPKTSTVQ